MFTGALTALVTPLRGGQIDQEALRRLVESQITAGINGLVPVGTTGESPTLSMQEHIDVVRIVVEAAQKRVPVVAGAGSNSTREACELAIACKAVGADGLLQVTPYYNRPTQQGLVHHFRTVLEAAPLPTVLYNIPGRTGCDLLPETVAQLAELPDIVGIKEASGNPIRAQQILSRTGDRLVVLSGDDSTAVALYALGARGLVSVVSNLLPAEVTELCRAAGSGNYARALELHRKLTPLGDLLFVETNPIPVKAALAMMGQIQPDIRSPLLPLSGKHKEALRAALASLGLI